jgi:hypothetical protein
MMVHVFYFTGLDGHFEMRTWSSSQRTLWFFGAATIASSGSWIVPEG